MSIAPVTTSTTRTPAPPSPFLRSLRAAIEEDFEPERELCCKVACYMAAGWKRSEIARTLDVPPAALRSAEQRVRRIVELLGHGDD
jgi:hypothetical protein